MNVWLSCSAEPGMLPGEYAVTIDTLNCGRVSLFAQADKVREAMLGEYALSVEMLDLSLNDALVRLPSPPFEISSQCVRIAQSQLWAV